MARKKRILKLVAWLAAAPLVYVLVLASPYFASALFAHNFHEVVPGKVFRSAEMSHAELGKLIDEHKLKGVIDLRLSGTKPDENGETEEQLVRAHGAEYRSVPMSSGKMRRQRERLLALADAFDGLPQPLLIHCTSGSERTGVASALWLMEKEHKPLEEADDQLALRYGFNRVERGLRTLLQGEPTLDRVVTEFALAREQGPISFRDWVASSPRLGAPEK